MTPALVSAALVFAGSAAGAVVRYLTALVVSRRGSAFPWATLAVNVVGSLAIGGTAAAAAAGSVPAWVLPLVGTGLCGGLTTFSTFGYETVRLAEERMHLAAVLNVVAGLGLGLLAVVAGWSAVSAILG